MRLIAGFYTSCRCHKLLITLSCPSLSVRLRPRGWTQLTCPAAAWRSCLLSSFTAMTSHTSISKTTLFPCTKVFQHLPGEFMSLLHSLHSDWIYCTLCVREHKNRRSQQMKSSIPLFVFFSLLDVERPSMTLTVFGATICFRKEAAWIKLQMTSEWEIVKFGWLKESHIGDERFDMQPPAVWDTGLFLVSQSSWSNSSNITVIWSSFFVSALSKYF